MKNNSIPIKPKLIYILGYGRSGSTLLDTYLSAHSEIQGLGELMHLFNDYQNESLPTDINQIVKQAYKDQVIELTPQAANELTQSCQTWSLNPDIKKISQFKKAWFNIINRLGKDLRSKVLVDSSKSTRVSFWRPFYLESIGFDVTTIFLKRDYKAVNYSVAKRGSNRTIEGKHAAKTTDLLIGPRSALSYIITHQLIFHRLLKRLKKTYILSYEEFTEDSFGLIGDIIEEMGLPVDGLPKNGDFFSTDNLAVRGNRMRRNNNLISIKKDVAYESQTGFINGVFVKIVQLFTPSISKFAKKVHRLNKTSTFTG